MSLVGLALFENGATPPSFPHVACSDGYAWMDEEARRACFSTSIAVSAIIVAQAIDPEYDLPAIDRMIACAQMNETQLKRLFPVDCKVCGADHHQVPLRHVRILRDYVHPDAVGHIREAKIPEYLLRRPHYLNEDDGPPEGASGKEMQSYEQMSRLIPVWRRDPDRTLAAQIAWSMQYRLGGPQRKGAVPKVVKDRLLVRWSRPRRTNVNANQPYLPPPPPPPPIPWSPPAPAPAPCLPCGAPAPPPRPR